MQVNKGYEKKKIIGEALMREFREPENYFPRREIELVGLLDKKKDF